MNFLDLFAQKLREKREQKKITQRELAERLNMCTRTVIEIEKCKSNPKFETVALISKKWTSVWMESCSTIERRRPLPSAFLITLQERVKKSRNGT